MVTPDRLEVSWPFFGLRLCQLLCHGLPLVCSGSVVGHLGLLSGVLETGSKAVFHVVVTFAGDSKKQTVIGNVAIVL